MGELLDIAASLKHELEDLQSTVDSEGITYTTVSREGNTMVREHPAHKCLQETRQRGLQRAEGVGVDCKGEEGLDAMGVEEYDPDFCSPAQLSRSTWYSIGTV